MGQSQRLTAATLALMAIPIVQAEPSGPRFEFSKTSRILIDTGGPGKFDECQAKYPCVLKVGDEWWMWYNGRQISDCNTSSIGLAKSRDGLNWTKSNEGNPVFRHGPKGSAAENQVDHPAVVRFDGRYHMWHSIRDARNIYQVGYATSPDGVNWTRENNGQPVLRPGPAGKFDDRQIFHPTVLRDDHGTLHMWYNGLSQVMQLGYATSQDGIHWTRQNDGNPVLAAGTVGDTREGSVYNCHVIHEQGLYRMWYTAELKEHYGKFAPESGAIRYAESQDGIHWTRDPVPTFYNGPPGSIDEYAAFAPFLVRRDDGKMWMYFTIMHLVDVPAGKDARRGRISLALPTSGQD